MFQRYFSQMRGALARLILSYHVMSDNVRSNRGAWSRQPCAGNLATGEPHVSAARLMAVLSGTTSYCARPTSTSKRLAPAQQKQQPRSLAVDSSVTNNCAKAKNVYAGNTRRILRFCRDGDPSRRTPPIPWLASAFLTDQNHTLREDPQVRPFGWPLSDDER